jgi:sugar phosphate isomerase/epimerase
MISRRELAAWSAAAAALPNRTAPPAASAPPYKLSLAAYSMRQFLDLKNPKMTLADFIQKCADWGFEGTELTEYYFEKPVTPEYVMRLKRLAIKLGLDVTGTPIGNSFTFPPGAQRDGQIESVKRWIDVSADLGSPAIRVFSGGAPKGTDEATARGWAVECLKICCDHAARRGVVLALENHGGLTARADGVLAIVEQVQHEWFGVNLDTGNFHVDDPYTELERCAPHAVTCQVKAEMSVKGKRSAADYGRIVGILRKAGYRGYLTLEYESAEDPHTAIPKHLKLLRDAASG